MGSVGWLYRGMGEGDPIGEVSVERPYRGTGGSYRGIEDLWGGPIGGSYRGGPMEVLGGIL